MNERTMKIAAGSLAAIGIALGGGSLALRAGYEAMSLGSEDSQEECDPTNISDEGKGCWDETSELGDECDDCGFCTSICECDDFLVPRIMRSGQCTFDSNGNLYCLANNVANDWAEGSTCYTWESDDGGGDDGGGGRMNLFYSNYYRIQK